MNNKELLLNRPQYTGIHFFWLVRDMNRNNNTTYLLFIIEHEYKNIHKSKQSCKHCNHYPLKSKFLTYILYYNNLISSTKIHQYLT